MRKLLPILLLFLSINCYADRWDVAPFIGVGYDYQKVAPQGISNRAMGIVEMGLAIGKFNENSFFPASVFEFKIYSHRSEIGVSDVESPNFIGAGWRKYF